MKRRLKQDAKKEDEVPDALQKALEKKRKNQASSVPVGAHHKKIKKNISRFPTTDELCELQEAGNTFSSNLFHMQVKELLSELKPKVDNLSNWLAKLKKELFRIPPSETYSVNDFSWMIKQIKYPIIQHPKHTKGVFKFLPPTKVQEIGSFALETVCSAEQILDVAVEIPKEYFQQMDFVNHRYCRKRAIYLCYIARYLFEANFVEHLKFSYQRNCHLTPILLIRPKGNFEKHFSVALYPHAEEGSFKLSRFIPKRNNVRSSWYLGSGKDSDIPTPYYNSTVLSDLLLPSLNDHLKEQISSQNLKDGIILFKVWCIQRGLISGSTGFSGFIIAMLMTYLLKKRKINPLMSSYQIFRCALIALQNENLTENGITLCDEERANQPLIADFHELSDVVFVDPSGFLNLCYNMTRVEFSVIQHEAKLAVKVLDESANDSFNHLFMTKITFSKKYDYLLNLSGPKKFGEYAKNLNIDDNVLNYGKDTVAFVVPKICELLKKGLKERIQLLDVKTTPCPKWNLSDIPPNPNKCQVTIGFLLNPDVPLNNLEKGPSTDDPLAEEFKKFWGKKSEMRRFQDGTIREACLWPAKTIDDKRKVFCSMVKYIMERHIGASSGMANVTGTEVNFILNIPEAYLPLDSPPFGTGEEAHTNLMQSFSDLTKQLRNLKELPLLITSVQGTSPAYRFSETFPPVPALHPRKNRICHSSDGILYLKESATRSPPYVPALKAVIQFEGSGKWPDDVEAIKRVKAAFYIKIADHLKTQYPLTVIPFPNYVDVLKDGFIFRFEISCHKEMALMKRLLNDSTKKQDNKELRTLECSTQIIPKLNSILHGIHQCHNTYGTSCRLAKRWLSSQLLHEYLPSVAVELLMAYLYIRPEPYECPNSPQVAFIRFLSLCHTYDWETNPLVVNLNNELTKDDIEEVHRNFTLQRSNLPPMTIATPLDKGGALWTREEPTIVILRRLITVAKASVETLEKQLCNPSKSDFKQMFRPPFDPYDVIIHLKSAFVPGRYLAVDFLGTAPQVQQRPYEWSAGEKYPVVEFNPAELYLKELRDNFGNLALFFYDIYGGDYIAVAFKPASFHPRKFTASRANCHTITNVAADGSMTIAPDIEAILQDFKRLGHGLVSYIQKLTDKWTIA